MIPFKKIRCFVVHRATGVPRSGITVSLTAEDGGVASLVLGILTSDRVGYLSFDISKFDALTVTRLWLTPLAEAHSRINVLAPTEKARTGAAAPTHETGPPPSTGTATSEPCESFVLNVDSAPPADEACAQAVFPAVQSADPCDYRLSPGSFVTIGSKLIGDDCCENLVPSTLPVQEYVMRRVISRAPAPESSTDGRIHTLAAAAPDFSHKIEPINVTQLQPPNSRTIGFGEVLEYRQQWFSLGHSLGEIRYSLALAPGEAVEVAVVDWSRQDQASRTDAITSTEYLANQLTRDRSIGETVDSMLNETQDGWSLMGGTAGAANYSYGTFNIAGDHAIGGSVAHSSGDRNLEADSLQSLHDSTNQATAVVRTLNATVVMQSTQAEQNVLQTRRVANHNHCHALTIEYYEVLRHYRLHTVFSGRRKAILLPFEPFTFDWSLAIRYRTLLVPNLLDASLASAFDAILRYHYGSALYPSSTTTPPPATTTPATTTTYFTGHKSLTVDAAKANDPKIFIQNGSRVRMTATGNVKFSHSDFGSGSDADGSGQPAASNFYAPGKNAYSLVCRLGNTWFQGGTSAEFVTQEDDYLVLQANDEQGSLSDNSGSWAVELDVYAPPPAAPAPAQPTDLTATPTTGPTKDSDAFAQQVLLQHLNGNRGYYNRVVWLRMDDSDRQMALEAALVQFPGVAANIDMTPLAVSGNIVAFGYDGAMPTWTDTRPTDPTEPLESIVTLPTRGVFAEAMLGHCNACEKRDVTRMWDWTQMTTEEPPPITDVTPGPRGTPNDVTQGSLPQNVVTIMQPPAAPDPTGLAAALRAISTPNIFRDMSGLQEVSTLLGTLVNGAVNSLPGAQKVAQQAQQKIQAMQAQQGQTSGQTTGGQATGTQTRTQPNDANAASQVDKLKVIGDANQSGLISDQQASAATMGVLGGEIIPAGVTEKNIASPLGIDVSQVQNLIDWNKVASTSNYYFAFIRASRGTTLDTRFQTNWVAARNTRLMCGAYHYWLPQIAGKTQAQTLISQLGPLQRGDLPPVIDVEESAQYSDFTGLAQANLENNIQEFMDTIKAEYGVYPIIYTNPGFWKDPHRMNNSSKFSSYFLWIANYSPKNDPTLPGGWPVWDFWQMTDSGRVDGINVLVDVDMYSGTLQQLQIMAGMAPVTSTVTNEI